MNTLPPEVEHNILLVLVSYLLYEKKEQTVLAEAFVKLVEERHAEFHDKEVEWKECRNQVCVDAGLLLKARNAPEIMVTPLAAQLMHEYGVRYMPSPGGLYAKLEKKPEGLPDYTANAKQQVEKLIVVPS